MKDNPHRIPLTLEDFRALVRDGVIEKPLQLAYEVLKVDICLQDIGWAPMFCAVSDAASPSSGALARIGRLLADEFNKLEDKAEDPS